MLRILKGEMVKKSLKPRDFANLLNLSEKSVRDKLNGKTPIQLQECQLIREKYFPEFSLDFLFEITQKAS